MGNGGPDAPTGLPLSEKRGCRETETPERTFPPLRAWSFLVRREFQKCPLKTVYEVVGAFKVFLGRRGAADGGGGAATAGRGARRTPDAGW